MKKIVQLFGFLAFALLFSCNPQKQADNKVSNDSTFRIVFMTDIHLQPELNAVEGFRRAMDSINKIAPDLVISGGDLIMDALAQKQSRADSLYFLYKEEVKRLKMPLYNTVGNHELFGVYPTSGVDTTDSLYGVKMFESKLGQPFYAFTHKNWKFIVLNSITATKDRRYIGYVGQEQLAWLKSELAKTDSTMPLVLVAHIPLLTSITQFNQGSLVASTEGLVVNNSREILDVFSHHNLKLVLQGHLHILEDNYIKNIHFITGGAVCGGWWKGPHDGNQEGFLQMDFKGADFTWKYIDYGWSPELNKK